MAPMELPSCSQLNHDIYNSYRRIVMQRTWQTEMRVRTCIHMEITSDPGLRSTPVLLPSAGDGCASAGQRN